MIFRESLNIGVLAVVRVLYLVQVTVIGLKLGSIRRLLVLTSVQAMIMIQLIGTELCNCIGMLLAQLLLLCHVIHLDLMALRVIMLNEPLEVVLRAPAAVLLPASHHRRPLRSLHGLKLVLLAIGHLAQVAMILLSSLHRCQKTGMRSLNHLFRNLVLDCSPVTMNLLNFLEMLDVGRSCPL